MPFGLSWTFVIAVIVCLIITWATGDWLIGLVFFLLYVVIKIIINFMKR
jgi:hypothetical protein